MGKELELIAEFVENYRKYCPDLYDPNTGYNPDIKDCHKARAYAHKILKELGDRTRGDSDIINRIRLACGNKKCGEAFDIFYGLEEKVQKQIEKAEEK